VRTIADEQALATVRRLAADEALLLGPSSGLAVAAALDVARELDETQVVVAIAPDGAANYLSSLEWSVR
jgi:cystathionine beta-synthase/cysteine synthase A